MQPSWLLDEHEGKRTRSPLLLVYLPDPPPGHTPRPAPGHKIVSLPEQLEESEDEATRKGLPDACIYAEYGWESISDKSNSNIQSISHIAICDKKCLSL